ncbi:hypothetical protein ACR6C2_45115, partial [Streptomyces sp. INA 01156]
PFHDLTIARQRPPRIVPAQQFPATTAAVPDNPTHDRATTRSAATPALTRTPQDAPPPSPG